LKAAIIFLHGLPDLYHHSDAEQPGQGRLMVLSAGLLILIIRLGNFPDEIHIRKLAEDWFSEPVRRSCS